MKALSLIQPGEARIVDVPPPDAKRGELLLRVDMVGLCGSDLNSFRGKNPLITYPRILGHEIAATVVRGTAAIPAGTRVTVSPYTSCGMCSSCRRGRENACRNNQTFGVQRDGALTEFLAVPAYKAFASTLPARDLCLVEPLTVGFHAAARGKVSKTDIVAVLGCGGIGLGAISGASTRGARVIAVDVDDAKLNTGKLAGATDIIHAGRENLSLRLREITDGDGPDVVIEAIGSPDTFRLAVDEVAYTGRVVYIGYAKEHVAYDTKLFVQKELNIIGSRNALPEDFSAVMRMLESGQFPVAETVTAVVPLEEAPSILEKWSTTPASYTKIMIEMHS